MIYGKYSSTVVLDGVSGHSGMVDANWLYTESENDMSLKIVAIKQKLAIRETMAFTTKKVVDYDPFTNKTVVRTRPSATGKIMHILDIGQSVDIAPMPGIQPDSWQWFKIRNTGIANMTVWHTA